MFSRYIGVHVAYRGVVLYTNCSFGTWIPGRSVIYTEVAQGWQLKGVPLTVLSPIPPAVLQVAKDGWSRSNAKG